MNSNPDNFAADAEHPDGDVNRKTDAQKFLTELRDSAPVARAGAHRKRMGIGGKITIFVLVVTLISAGSYGLLWYLDQQRDNRANAPEQEYDFDAEPPAAPNPDPTDQPDSDPATTPEETPDTDSTSTTPDTPNPGQTPGESTTSEPTSDSEGLAPGFNPDVPVDPSGGVDRNDPGIVVFNHAGIAGLAGRTADVLQERGWAISDTTDLSAGLTNNTIYYPSGYRATAELLAQEFRQPIDVAPMPSRISDQISSEYRNKILLVIVVSGQIVPSDERPA